MGQQKATTIQGDDIKPKAESVGSPKSGKKKKSKLRVPRGRIYVQSSYNNTIITITDASGNVISWGSAGHTGFKGSKKSTPYAAQKTMEDALSRVKDIGLQEVDIFVKGIGTGRESSVRALQNAGFHILSIKDQTPIPHGGVRPKKARRV
ncbi:MAG: 30S ribosomal protein S11 [Candidatus Doudnabacteria bacterium]|nr:30S ribosomal protein S11 [Candidatus Doudnabacteria bacterium]